MSITVASRKGKGRALQQKVRDMILKVFKHLHPDDVKSTAMGQGGEDVQLSPAARKVFPYSIECKANKAFSVYKFYEQAQANCPKGSEPIVVIKGNHKKPLVLVNAEHFIKLTKRKK
jgi:hypothetical protein